MENKGFFGNLFNKKDNSNIEKMISADQNTENLKNEIMGNTTNNLPTFDRPNIVNGSINDTNIPTKKEETKDTNLSQPLTLSTPTDKPAEAVFPFAQPGSTINTNNQPETLGLEVPGGGGVRIHHVDDLPPEKEEEDVLKKVNTLAGANQEKKKVDVSKVKRRVRPRSKRNTLELQSFGRLSVFLITFGLLVLISTGIYLFLANQATKSGSSLVLGDVIQVRNELNYYSLITLSAETNATLPKKSTTTANSGITSNSGLNNNNNNDTLNTTTTTTTTARSSDQFIRIKIEITNKSSNVAAIRGYNKFYILDSNNKLLSECLTAEDLKSYTVTDAFPSTIEGGKTVSGYIYCKSSINTLPILQIVSATNQNQVLKDGSISGGSTYFVHLAKSKK